MITVSPKAIPTLKKISKTEPAEFKAVKLMQHWMFTPSYLEVDYDTCSAVFLRSPLPIPDVRNG